MKSLLLLGIVCSIALIGCASGGVGPRLGLDVPVSGLNAEGNVTTTSADWGFIGGATFEGYFSNVFGLRIDPQIHTAGGEVGFSGARSNGTNVISVTGSMDMTSTILDIPGMVTFKVTDPEANVNPFFCIGLMMSVPTSITTRVNGTQTVSDGSQSSSAPFAESQSSSGAGEPMISLIMSGGITIPVSKNWDFRAEARLNQILVNQTFAYYYLYASGYGSIVDVSIAGPSTTLGITAGMMIHL